MKINKILGIIVIIFSIYLIGTSAGFLSTITPTTLGTFQKTQYDNVQIDSVLYYTVSKDIPISPKCEVIDVSFPDGNKWIARSDAFSTPLYKGDIRSSSWHPTFSDSDTYSYPIGRYYVTAGIYSDCSKSSAISNVINTYFDITAYSTQPICTAPEAKCSGGLAYNCAGGVWTTSACAYNCEVVNDVARCVTKPIICGDGSCHPTEIETCPVDCGATEKIGSKDCIDNWVSIYTLNSMNSYSWLKVLDCKTGDCNSGTILTQPYCDMNNASCITDSDCIYSNYKCLFEDETSTNKVCKKQSITIDECDINKDCDDGDWLTVDKCVGTIIQDYDTGLNKKCVHSDATVSLSLIGIISIIIVLFISMLILTSKSGKK